MPPKGGRSRLPIVSHADEKFVRAAEAKALLATTTLEKAELAAKGSTAPTRSLRRRSSEQAVSKILKDNFPLATPSQTDDKINSRGQTLREQLRDDRKRPEVRMGLKHYAALRIVFDDELSPLRLLRVLDPSEPINPMVEMAIKGLESHPVSLVQMQALFCVDLQLSQRNVVAILKGLLKLRSSTSLPQLSVLIEGMRWIQRNRVEIRFKQEVSICRQHFDEVMSKHHDIVTSAGRSTAEWWSLVSDVGSLAFSAVDFSVCVKHVGEWTLVAENLSRLVCGSLTGKKIFGAAYKTIEVENMQKLVKRCAETLFNAANSDKTALVRARADFAAQAEAAGVNSSSAFDKTKQLPVVYRGVEVLVWCHSYLEFFNFTAMAALKGLAVDSKLLPSCLCEDDLVQKPRPRRNIIVHAELLTEVKIARATVADWASELEDVSGDSILNIFKFKMGMLKAIDKHIVIEEAFFQAMSGDSGQTRFKQSVLQCLPSLGSPMDWAVSRGQLEQLLATPFAKYCGKGLLIQSQTVLAWLRSGEANRAPQCAVVSSEFLTQARAALGNFLVHVVDVGDEITGKAAVDAIVELLKTAVAKKEQPSLLKLRPLAIFQWLLDLEQNKLVQEWTDACLQTKARPADVAMADPPAKKRKGKAKTAECEAAASAQLVSSYFD